MAIDFPTALDSFTNPSATDLLEVSGALNHVTQHGNINDAVEALEAKMGINSSAVTTSHDYKLSLVTGTNKAVPQASTALTANSVIYAGASGVVASAGAATNGQLLIGSTGVAPVLAALTGTANQVTVTNGAGTITLSLPQSIAVTSNVQFNNIEIDGALNHDGSTAGFFNTTPTTQPTAMTVQETTITHTAPGAADYAIQDLTQTSPFGFVTKDEGNTVLQVIANLQTRLQEAEDKLQLLGLIA